MLIFHFNNHVLISFVNLRLCCDTILGEHEVHTRCPSYLHSTSLLQRAFSEEVKVKIFNQWPQGFYGQISIDLEDEVEDGWQITLKFSKPIKELLAWNANVDATSNDKMVCILKNRFWNKKLKAKRLKFRFLGYKAKFNERAPKISGEFTRLGEESGSGF